MITSDVALHAISGVIPVRALPNQSSIIRRVARGDSENMMFYEQHDFLLAYSRVPVVVCVPMGFGANSDLTTGSHS